MDVPWLEKLLRTSFEDGKLQLGTLTVSRLLCMRPSFLVKLTKCLVLVLAAEHVCVGMCYVPIMSEMQPTLMHCGLWEIPFSVQHLKASTHVTRVAA